MNAIRIYKYISTLNPYGFSIQYYPSKDNVNQIVKLFHEIKVVKPIKDSKAWNEKEYFFLISASKGSYSEFSRIYIDHYTYYLPEGKYVDRNKMKEEWPLRYSYRRVWYGLRMVMGTGSTTSGKPHYGIWLNGTCLAAVPYDKDTSHHYERVEGEMDIAPLLDWITQEVHKALELLKKGQYMEYVDKHFPVRYREGSISRKKYWKYVPSDVKLSFGNLDPKIKREFLKWVKEHQNDQPKIDNFTSGDYFRACKIYYEIKGLIRENEGDLTPRELYLKHSDGRCGGLTDLDIDSASEFADWLRSGCYEHHAFEIDYAHKWLTPYEENGKIDLGLTYYLDEQNAELIGDVLEMVKRGVPIGARHFTALAKIMEGHGTYSIVSPCYNSNRWISYRDFQKSRKKSTYNRDRLSERRVLPLEAPEEMMNEIKWKPLPKIEMIKQ